jgi:SNF2 family DNA or RNA helicase
MKMSPFMLRRLKAEVAAELPDKVTQIAGCPMLPAQRRLYNRLLAQYHDSLSEIVDEQGFEKARFSVFSALLRLRQCCCHPALLKGVGGTTDAESGKMDLFFQLLDEAMDGGHRVLVFSQFVQMLHILRDALKKRGIAFAYLDGSTRDRMAQVDAFNNNANIPVFLVSLKAGGSGLNLTGANVVIHYDPWWNPAIEDQATDRTHRIGQSKTVYSIKLITENSIEQKVIALQQRKRTLINATFGSATSAERALSWEDVRDLLRPDNAC